MNLQVEPVETIAALRTLGPEWQELFAASRVALPFFSYEWAECWWNHMRQERRSVRDELHFRAIRTETGQLVAIAPLVLTERPSIGPIRMRYLQFLGADPNITEMRGILARPNFEREAYLALLQDLQETSCDWIHWSGLCRDTEEAAPVRGRLSLPLEETPAQLLILAPSWEEYRAGLKRNIRESLRKCYNSLKRDNHSFALRVSCSPPKIASALDRFFVLHRARAEVNTGVRHPNVFETLAAQRFLRDVCDRLAKIGIMRVFELLVNGEVVATRIGFQFSDTLYLYYSGYDPVWGRYSVMTTTLAETIKYAICEGLTTVNLSTGRDIGKQRWGPSEVVYESGVQITANPRARLAYAVYAQAFRIRDHKAVRFLTR